MSVRFVGLLLLFAVFVDCAASSAAEEAVAWRVVAGERKEVTEDGQKLLVGSGRMLLSGIPDGEFAVQVDFLTNIGGCSAMLLLRGDALEEGMLLGVHASGGWTGFQNNLVPGDKKLHNLAGFPISLDKVEWWTLKVQQWNGRVMAKAWKSSGPEPEQWMLDFPVSLDSTGPVGLETSCKLRNLKLVPVRPTKFRVVTEDNRRRRFGQPREEWIINVKVRETAEEIIVSSELTDLFFNRSRCSIAVAEMRDERFPVGSLPDLKLVDATGQEYRQRYAIDGDLKLMPSSDDRWVVLEGSCTPRTQDGTALSCPFLFEYRIHKQTGLIAARAVPRIAGDDVLRVRQLALVNELADVPEQGIDDYQIQVQGGHGWRRIERLQSRDDGILSGGRSCFGTWGNGRCAFQVAPTTFKYCSIGKELIAPVEGKVWEPVLQKAYCHLALGTRNGHRFLDMVFVNHKDGEEIEIKSGDVKYEYTFSFLPWRRYRPRVELACSSSVWGKIFWSLSMAQEKLQRIAAMGATLHGLGYPPLGLAAPESDRIRAARQADEFHYYGLKDMPAWVGGTIWPRQLAFEHGWITKDEARRAARWDTKNMHMLYGSIRINHEAEVPDQMCVNNPVWWKLFIDHETIPVLQDLGSSAVYWDWTYVVYYCDNPAHGDDGVALTPVGHLEMIDRFRDQSARLPQRPLVMASTYDAHTTSVSRADMHNPGEAFKGSYLPNSAEHNLVFSSLLYGTQCVYHTQGGVAHDTPRVYELALARCATVFLYDEPVPVPSGAPPDIPMGFNAGEREMWQRYMTPLVVFGVEDSEYRHPFDEDYGQFCRTNPGVTTVLYFKDGRVLVVVAKEDETATTGKVSLNVKNLGVSGRKALLYDVINSTTKTFPLPGDILALPEMDLTEGPRIFVLQAEPSEPTVVWYSPSVWNAKLNESRKKSDLVLTGVPMTHLEAHIWCGSKGAPTVEFGGTLKSYDRKSDLAIIAAEADRKADAKVRISW